MNTTHINYQEYLESYAWKALKKTKLDEQPQCECCGALATSVHHLSYDRLGREKPDDIVSICERCHEECHHVGGYQIKNDEEILRRRFEEIRAIYLGEIKVEFSEEGEDYFLNGEKLQKILDCSIVIFEEQLNSWCNRNTIIALLKSERYIYCLQENIYNELENESTNYRKSDNLIKMSIVWKYEIGCQGADISTILNRIHIDYDSFTILPWKEELNSYHVLVYIKDKNNVYYDLCLIKGADPATFEVITLNQPGYENNWLSKDKNYLYYYGEKIEGSDSSTFEIINRKYSKDKNYVYFYYKKIEGSDGLTFELLSEEYSKDKNNVYFYEKQSVSRELLRLEGADPKSFEILQEGYSKDKNFVYYNGEKIEGSDGSTFELMNENYSKDKNNVYYTENTIYSRELLRLEGADPKSFEILQEGYSKDKNYVYLNGCIRDGLDGGTFIIINKWYIKDKDSVYYLSCNKVEGADPATFEPIDGYYAKDKDNIYYNHIRLDGIKSDDYKIIGDYNEYISNKKCVYYRQWKIEGADSASFSGFKESPGYAKDKNFVYWDEKRIEGADPENFHEVLKKRNEEHDETMRFYNH